MVEARDIRVLLARRRVPLGFIASVLALALARPTSALLALGLVVALVGQGIRIWAAGHLEKGREVTRSGPYRWMRHPLYVGSTVLALGVVIAAGSAIVAVIAALYLGATLTAAIRSEETFLRQAFGDTYDQYRESRAATMTRRFSLERAVRNREYRAVCGLIAGFALLALKRYWLL